jgi:hypothetical protein
MANAETTRNFCQNGGRVAHFHETDDDGPLIATIAYTRTDEGEILFGSTIYRPGDDPWTKQPHTETAIGRATVRPISIPDADMSGAERKVYVREAMKTNYRGSRVRVRAVSTD